MAKEKGQEGAVANSQDALNVPKARVLAEVFAPNGKIRVELLPSEVAGGSAEGGSVNLQPLIDRVAALEAKPEAEHVDLNPLNERVTALENAPKVADKSQEVTTLQGTVAEHTTSIASNVQRITALESRPAPEAVNLETLTERMNDLDANHARLGVMVIDHKKELEILESTLRESYVSKRLLGIGISSGEIHDISEISYYIGYIGELGSLYHLVVTKEGDILCIVNTSGSSEENKPAVVYRCLNNNLIYKYYKMSGTTYAQEGENYDNVKVGVYSEIPGIGVYHVRDEYHGLKNGSTSWGLLQTIPSSVPIAEQIKKLLGLS